jgi:hypothetical protein
VLGAGQELADAGGGLQVHGAAGTALGLPAGEDEAAGHPPPLDHPPGQLGGVVEIVLGPRAGLAEGVHLGGPATQEHDELGHQLPLGHDLAVLPERPRRPRQDAGPGDDGGVRGWLDAAEQEREQGVARFVVGEQELLVLTDEA